MTRLMAAAHANLLTAYRDATYEICADGQLIPLTIGGPLPPECRPPASGCVHALLTACNPGSIRLADEDNAQRMQRLHDRLSNLVIEWSPALGCSPDRTWLEPSCWLTDVDVERVDVVREVAAVESVVVVRRCCHTWRQELFARRQRQGRSILRVPMRLFHVDHRSGQLVGEQAWTLKRI